MSIILWDIHSRTLRGQTEKLAHVKALSRLLGIHVAHVGAVQCGLEPSTAFTPAIMFDDCFIIILGGAYDWHVVLFSQRVTEAQPAEEARGCERDNAVSSLAEWLGQNGPCSCRIIYSISSSLGSKEARRWHASGKLISPCGFHHRHIWE